MTKAEHLDTIAMEECNEVAQRISKAKRFGRYEVQPMQSLNNVERVVQEFHDLVAVLDLAGYITVDFEYGPAGVTLATLTLDRRLLFAKIEKINKYLEYAKACGTLQESK